MKNKLIQYLKNKAKVTGNAYVQFIVSVLSYALVIPFVIPIVKILFRWTVWLWNYYNF